MTLPGRVLILALVATTMVACAARRQSKSAKSDPIPDIPLKVTNHNWLDITIYVLHDGQRTRIGMVTGSSAEDFVLPARLLGQAHQLALIGEAIGSNDVARTETLNIQPGQYIEWTLETDLRRSSVGVY
jgi:hypothetical protein